jgi:inorganic phosphate transporter, PiT family
MSEIEIVVYSTIITALFFDFVNGFHDSANSIATVVTILLKDM